MLKGNILLPCWLQSNMVIRYNDELDSVWFSGQKSQYGYKNFIIITHMTHIDILRIRFISTVVEMFISSIKRCGSAPASVGNKGCRFDLFSTFYSEKQNKKNITNIRSYYIYFRKSIKTKILIKNQRVGKYNLDHDRTFLHGHIVEI